MSNYNWGKFLDANREKKRIGYEIVKRAGEGKTINKEFVIDGLVRLHEIVGGPSRHREYTKSFLTQLYAGFAPQGFTEGLGLINVSLEHLAATIQAFISLCSMITKPYAQLIEELPDRVKEMRKTAESQDKPMSLDAIADMELTKIELDKRKQREEEERRAAA